MTLVGVRKLLNHLAMEGLVVASDYPHGDPSHEENMVAAVMRREGVPLRPREKILSDNPKRLYGL